MTKPIEKCPKCGAPAVLEAAYAVSERREGDLRTDPLNRAVRAAYEVQFGVPEQEQG